MKRVPTVEFIETVDGIEARLVHDPVMITPEIIRESVTRISGRLAAGLYCALMCPALDLEQIQAGKRRHAPLCPYSN
jgi:hypothetical protein